MQGLGKVLFYFMGKRVNTAKWDAKRGHWKINVQKDEERRSFYSSTPGRTGQREANAKADAWLDDNINNVGIRVSVAYKKYFESVKLTTSKSNWRKVDSFGRVWILPLIGNKKMSVLNEQHLQAIIDKCFAEGRSKKHLINLRATIVSFIKYCRKAKYTTLFPENLQIPKGARSMQKRILQPEDIIKLFSIDTVILYNKRRYDDFINAFRFQVLTGLRPGELFGLRWQDIIGDMVYIKRSINIFGEETKGKNENAVRHFALSDIAKQILEEQRKISNPNTDRIFGEISLSTYEKRWTRYCESNDIPHISPYEMRHTFVSIAKNLSEGQIKTLVGHSKNMDTFGIYGHEINNELQKTAHDLDAIFHDILNIEKK